MIFVDTGALAALYLARDQYHQQARAAFATLPLPFVTTNHVVDELATLLGRQGGYRVAAARVATLYQSPSVEIVASTQADEMAALAWMLKFADHGIGFTDCTSFAIMRRLGLRAVFTFDRHFRDAGFELLPVVG